MTPALQDAFEDQAIACESLGSPFMGRLLRLVLGAVTEGSALDQRLRDWDETRLSARHDSVPLRLAGALHGLRLDGHAELDPIYPPYAATDIDLEAGLRAALASEEARVLDWLRSPPQTNEVRRSASLIPVAHWLTARFGLPMVTSEVGASAGLNLNWDFFCLHAGDRVLGPLTSPVQITPEWRGGPAPQCPPYLAEAEGVDLNPLNPAVAQDALRLQAYLWPDQPDRLARTRAAIDLFNAPDTGGVMHQGDALAWLPKRLVARPGHLHLIYSTIAWQYLPDAARATGQAMIEAAGRKATETAPLAWFVMEADDKTPGAEMTLRLWPGDETIDMGRIDFHGRWVDWKAPSPT